MDDDYALLLARPPPYASTQHWSLRLRLLPVLAAFVSLLSITLAAALFFATGKLKELPGDSSIKIPTISRFGTYTPGRYFWSGGMHLSATISLPVWWGVRLAQTQRLKARTGVSKLDSRGNTARLWANAACAVGTFFSVCWFLAGSLLPMADYDGTAGLQDKAHTAIAALCLLAISAYGFITCFGVIRWARGVFLLTDRDLLYYRIKLAALGCIIVAAATAAIAAAVQKKWYPEDRDCAVEWCRQGSIQALGEYVVYPAALVFILSLYHDLRTVQGNITVDSLVL